MQEMFLKAVAFLKDKLNSSKSIDETEKKYRLEHSLRVAGIAKKIALSEGQDVFTAVMAAILHDVGKFETDKNIDHGRVSAEVARPFLNGLGISQKQADDIHYCIAVHVDGKAGYVYTHFAEADTVSDADNIDRFGVYRIYQTLVFDKIDQADTDKSIMRYEEYAKKMENLKNNYTLSTDSANKMFKDNLNIQMNFYRNFVNELKIEKQIFEID